MTSVPRPAHEQPVLMIVGCSRSGTTWLQHLLARHPRFVTTVELTTFSHYLPQMLQRYERERRNAARGFADRGLGFIADEAEFLQVCRGFVDHTYEIAFPHLSLDDVIIEKNPESTPHASLAEQILPNVRFLHLIRDGRDVATSLLAAGRDMGFAIHSPEKAAATWVRLTRSGLSAQHLSRPYMELRYEDLSRDPVAAVRGVVEFCDIEFNSAKTLSAVQDLQIETLRTHRELPAAGAHAPIGHFRSGTVGGWVDQLDPWEITAVRRVAGDLLDELGYEPKTAEPSMWDPAQRQYLRMRTKRVIARGVGRARRRLPFGSQRACS